MPALPSSGARSRPHHRILLVAGLLAALAATPTGVRPVAASTATTMGASIMSWVNEARAAGGLAPLQLRTDLASLAVERATVLAAEQRLSHEAPGCLSCQLTSRGITWHLWGETLASSSHPWGTEAARSMFGALEGSPSHWSLLMSDGFDQAGAGVARGSDGSAYLSIVLIDGDPLPKATPRPTAAPTRPAASGSSAPSSRAPAAPADPYVALRAALVNVLDARLRQARGDRLTRRVGVAGWCHAILD